MAKVDENFNVNTQRQTTNYQNKPNKDWVQFFPKMAPDEELIVRFPYNSVDQVDIRTVHSVKSGNRFVTVDCVRTTSTEPFDSCPLCARTILTPQGQKKMEFPLKTRGFVKMIYYSTVDGVVTPFATVWNCAADYAIAVRNYVREYGDLTSKVFKIKKRGSGLDTKYDIIPANPEFYNPEIYAIDFHAFENFKLSPWHLVEATPADINTFLTTGTFPQLVKSPAADTTNYTAPVNPYQMGGTPAQQSFNAMDTAQPASWTPAYQTSPLMGDARPRRNYEG